MASVSPSLNVYHALNPLILSSKSSGPVGAVWACLVFSVPCVVSRNMLLS